MIRGLYTRLALVMLTVFLLLGVVLFWVYETAGQQLQQETSQKLHLNLASYLVQDVDLYSNGKLDNKQTKKAFNKVMMLDPGTELYIISPQGKVLEYDAPDEKIIQRQISLEPIKQFLNDKESLPIVGDDPRSLKQKVFSVAPIPDNNGNLQSYLYIIIRGEAYDTVSTIINVNKSWWLGITMVAAALAFLLLTTLLLFYKLTRPLVRLKRDVTAFEQSEFRQFPEQALSLSTQNQQQGDELQQLRGSFYRMGSKITEQIDYLHKHDQLRREFLAHVSHDLRTPLAGMRAYLETLQIKGDALSAAERSNFLEKALLTNKQLSSMIDELFELARLEHGQVNINPEVIMISDLLSDLYASLSGLANDKGIRLSVQMESDNISVLADVARLERVFQNLIGNAIVYTPSGGSVTVNVRTSFDRKVLISVEDTGQGISTEELPHVFEPYFRSTNGQKAYHEGKGLGLAIASRLLSLHHTELQVESQPGVGTRFHFELPAD
ncbi:MAG: sensor histidine kinase [Thiolinea sp.]